MSPQELCEPVNPFSQISDAALDNLVRQILTSAPQSGIGLVRGALKIRGLRIQRHRIMAALQRLDPLMSAQKMLFNGRKGKFVGLMFSRERNVI